MSEAPEGGATDVLEALGGGRRLEMDGDAGRAELEFTVRPEFCHSGGIAQGGFVTGWIDAAMAHAAIARYGSQVRGATLEIKISFFRPATPGIVRAEGWIERGGRQTAFLEGQLLDAEGQLLAKGSSTARLVPNRQ
mgnify:CR=1 FL=1